jgi:G3E family GTPase
MHAAALTPSRHPSQHCLQVEFADVLVLNKLDLVTPEQADQLEALLSKLNRGAKVRQVVVTAHQGILAVGVACSLCTAW